ncbi:hypothetical protein C8Q76DRAFT_829857 [Earliella scabrosa]|nr:hypothetical protein C8Q76DRAFT_843914 [Earliella scabrosa]KAI0735918.1 hypothetical protein C8Q76DRAFT_829857 [Earliella scabrosa]
MAIWDTLEAVANTPESPVLAPTPLPPVGHKRARLDTDLTDDEEHPNASPARIPINANLVALAVRLSKSKKLRVEQARDLEDFSKESLYAQNIRLMCTMLALENKVDKLTPPPTAFEVSDALQKNLTSYAHGVIFSSKIPNYKGTVPLNHLLDICRNFRFDLPVGIEHDHAKWLKVKRAAGEALTQVRGKIKKLLVKSTKPRNNKAQHMDIFDLTKAIVKNTEYKVTLPLMARVALMRAVFDESQGDDYWDNVDARMQFIRTTGTTPDGIARIFKHLLREDRAAHGSGSDYEVEDVVDPLQEHVDESIQEAAARVAAATAAEGANDNRPEEEEEEEEAAAAGPSGTTHED